MLLNGVLLAASILLGFAVAQTRPDWMRRRQENFVRFFPLIAASGAVFAEGAPTGQRTTDLVYRAIFAAAIAFFGATAGSTVLVVAVAVCTVLAFGTWAAFPVALCCGAAVARKKSSRRWHMWSAVGALAVSQAVLWFSFSPKFGLSAVLAAVVGGCVMVSGLLHARRSSKRIANAGLAIGGGLALVAGIALLSVASNLSSEADVSVNSAKAGLRSIQKNDVEAAAKEFKTSRASFSRLNAIQKRPASRLLGLVPIVSQHFRSVAEITKAGEQMASAATDSSASIDLRRLRVEGSQVDLKALEQVVTSLKKVRTELAVGQTAMEMQTNPWLLGPYRKKLNSAASEIALAKKKTDGPALASEIFLPALGAEQKQRYFLAIVTPSEMRGSGGLIGNYGEITADKGRLALAKLGRNRDIAAGGDASKPRPLVASEDYERRWGAYVADEPGRWSNVTMSPDFPSVASVIADLYPKYGGSAVDGVITIDPTAMARLLKFTGPITVSDVTLTDQNAEKFLLFEQYVHFESSSQREVFLSEVAERLWGALFDGSRQTASILDTLGRSVSEKHVQLWFANEVHQETLKTLGVDSGVHPGPSDFASLVLQNGAGNKIDWFLKREYRYEAVVGEDGLANGTVEIKLTNSAPSTGLPDYIIGRAYPKPWEPGENVLLVSYYSPLDLVSATLDGKPWAPSEDREFGVNVYSGWVTIPSDSSLKIKLKLNGFVGSPDHYLLGLNRQPQISGDSVSVAVSSRDGAVLAAAQNMPLSKDALLSRP